MGAQNYGIDVDVAHAVAEEIKAVRDELGVEVAVVVGGGNIFRGVSKSAGNMNRSSADYIGMLATIMNAVVLQDALEKTGVYTRVHVGHRQSRNWRSPSSAAAPSATWRRAASSSSLPARATRISRPTRRPPCARSKSRPR